MAIINGDGIRGVLKGIFLYTLGLLIFSALAYWFWKHPLYNPIGAQNLTQVETKIEIVFRDVELKARKNGLKNWIAYCKKVDVEKNSSMVYLTERPHGEFYNPKLKDGEDMNLVDKKKLEMETYKWLSNLVEYDTDSDNFTFKGDVKITSDKEDLIETDELYWNNQNQVITSNKKTKITSKGNTRIISSDTLSARILEKIYDLKGNVKVLNNEEQTTMKSDNLSIKEKEDIYDLQGNVEIETVLTDEQQL